MLEARNLSVALGGRSIVEGINITVASGSCVGLIGPNGAGKSTVLRALAGAVPLAGGEVILQGQHTDGLVRRERARRVAYLPQERRVEWGVRVRDVVALGLLAGPRLSRSERTAKTTAALDDVEAIHLADRSAKTLSGGELARVLLARALATQAPLLLADEPMAGLDPSHQLHVMELLVRKARAGDGVLVVLHDLGLAARFCDRVVVLDRGRKVADGPPAEALTPRLLAETYGIEPLSGEKDGEPWLLPWRRVEQRPEV